MFRKTKKYPLAKELALVLAILLGSIPTAKAYGENHCAGNWIHWSPGASMSPPCLVFTNGLTGTDVNYDNRVKCTLT